MTINSEQNNIEDKGPNAPFSADLMSVAKETEDADDLKKKK